MAKLTQFLLACNCSHSVNHANYQGAKIRFDFSNGKKVLGVGSDASLEDSSIRVCEGVLQAINWILLPFEDTYMPDDDTDEGGV